MKKRNIITYLLIILIGCLFYSFIKQKSDMADKEAAILALHSKIETYETKLGQEVASKRSVILDRDNYKFLSDSQRVIIDKFKKVEPVVIIKTVFKIDTVYKTMQLDPVSNWYTFNHDDPWFNLSGKVKDDKIVIDPPHIPNELSIIGGWKKDGLLKPKYYAFDVANSNPYLKTSNIQAYTVKEKKKWYQTTVFKVGAGFVGGALIFK